MGIIINNKKQYRTRFLIWFLIIVLLAFSPLLVGMIGAWITEFATGKSCNEGNCAWMVLPWYLMFTLPVGGIIMLIYLAIILLDTYNLFKKP